MTKEELLSHLSTFPEDMNVCLYLYDRDGGEMVVDIEYVSVIKKWFGDEYEILIIPEEYGDFEEDVK